MYQRAGRTQTTNITVQEVPIHLNKENEKIMESLKGRKVQNIDVPVTNVFHKIKAAQNAKVVISRGGARSSKSHSLTQYFVERLFNAPEKRRMLIVRKTLPSLRLSVLPMFETVLDTYGIRSRIKEEKINLNYKYQDKLIHFGSIDDIEKIKSSEWNDIWLEEATDFSYDDYKQLKLRMSAPDNGLRNQIHLSFNPVSEQHWIKRELIDGKQEKDLVEIVSTYKDNPFLSQDYIDGVEALSKIDANFYRIYALGEWGQLGDLIFTNWEVYRKSLEEFGGNEIYGLDFGYTNPTSLVKLWMKENEVLVQEKIHKIGYTNTQLIERMKEVIPYDERRRCMVFADNAEPDRIMEINQAGFWCVPCKKPKGTTAKSSVAMGIDVCKRHKIFITEDSPNVIKEIKGYSYTRDKDDNILEEPIAFNDHSMSAIRYAIYTLSEGRPNIRIID